MWQTAQNSKTGYGPIFAFPASTLQVTCPDVTVHLPYTCNSDKDHGTSVSSFWSTTTLDTSGQPVAKLMLVVGLQDELGQTVVAG